ncbi:methionyl-tRNA formyltransferase [Glaciibacter superstes]|uniref:methionyl-tRNA formyltransferase n=1 Tax=Glaciibacter superstes TaxID=501023 RepID=UPI0003B71015|nr:methionyl-tRNA formyltransferase [Glaciibacter superstes]
MKLVFAGTPAAAVPSLLALAASDHEIVSVVSRADAPLGRKRVLTPSRVALAAAELGLGIVKTNRLDDAATATIATLGADLGVIVAYGGLVREPLLSAPRLGWINLHFSLLPRWRGAAPVQRAVIAGDEVTGAAVFQLVPELDAGDVFATNTMPIDERATAGSLLDALSHTGADLLLGVVNSLAVGTAVSHSQRGEVTLAPKLTLDDARVDWSEPASSVHNRVRGVTPEPGAFTLVGQDRFKLLETVLATGLEALPPGVIRRVDQRVLAGTGSDPIEILRVQPAGKRPMLAADWWRGVGAREVSAE